jgi:hypothetical protein
MTGDFERRRVRKSDHSHSTAVLEPSRQRVIAQRLHSNFYGEPEPSEQIAAAVLAALDDLDKGPFLLR